jgi:LPS O-antigen subunit length determinant protein (WzzB/FepE family)
VPEIRVKVSPALYVRYVEQAAELGISEPQYVNVLLTALDADEGYAKLLAERGMQSRIDAAKRRADGVRRRYAPRQSGLFN